MTPSLRSVPCVVLMDYLDQLFTRCQGVMYNFFNRPGGRHSKLTVLAIANTMDLPERTLRNKISSRLGLTRITFPGYTHFRLMTIIQSCLEGVSGNMVDADAVQVGSRKLTAISGDARRALDICRRAIEMVEYSPSKDNENNQPPSSPSRRKSGAISPSNATGSGLKAGAESPSPRRPSGVGEGMLRDMLDEGERIVLAQAVSSGPWWWSEGG
ncbi:hypothetical protein L873DRAFT_1788979 [Choiromyces venosus 120613-1]|uniref:Origin recognition complex subunit 1 n=1 Tax=Choiromyces venosus 120613-1 TaxID=1336337 RepID=A0A3N4JPY6_9PEZI|nr:hypothetical protein L873DRAFT_1788979 [Choiromyces venosus 120613-1]